MIISLPCTILYSRKKREGGRGEIRRGKRERARERGKGKRKRKRGNKEEREKGVEGRRE